MNKRITIGIIAVAILGLGYFFLFSSAFGEVSKDIQTPNAVYQNYTFFASTTSQTIYATTTTAVSTNITPYWDANGRKDNGYFVVAGAEEITFYFQRGDTSGQGNAGQSKFDIDVSNDGVNWYDYNYLQQNNVSLTATTTVTITGTTTEIVHLKDRAFYAVRCSVVETTDGEHSCRASARFK